MYAASLDDCSQVCANNAQCVTASFVGDKRVGHCYLKDKNNSTGTCDNVDGVCNTLFSPRIY